MASVVFDKSAENVDAAREKVLAVMSRSYTKEQRSHMYDEWAENYDHDQKKLRCPNYKVVTVADHLNKIVKDKNAKILDIGSGPGSHGKHLRSFGYTQIDGIDESEPMMTVARRNNVYDRYIVDAIGKHRLDIEDGAYDVITGSGAFGGMGGEVFEELTRITKQGGLIFLAINSQYYAEEYKGFGAKFDRSIQAYLDSNVWMLEHRVTLPGYVENNAANLTVVKKN